MTRAESGEVNRSIENLSTVVKSAKSKRPKLTKSKKSNLLKIKINSFKIEFFILRAKAIFTYL